MQKKKKKKKTTTTKTKTTTKKASVLEKLLDTTAYTGTSRARFDDEGKGQGMRGRDSPGKGQGNAGGHWIESGVAIQKLSDELLRSTLREGN